MNDALRQVGLLVSKDLRIEARGKQTISLVIVLGVLIIVVLGLGLGDQSAASGFTASSILWVAYLFGGALCFEKTMAVERSDDALAGLLLAPLDRGVIFISKLLANLALMAALALIVTPIAIMLFRFQLRVPVAEFALVIALGMLGFAAVGTLFSAAVSSTRLQGGLLTIIVFPLTLPVVIMTTQILRRRQEVGGTLDPQGLLSLALFDVVFLIASWLIFEFVLEP